MKTIFQLFLLLSCLLAVGFADASTSGPTAVLMQGPAVPIAAPPAGQNYTMTNSEGKKYSFSIAHIKDGKVFSFNSEKYPDKEWALYVNNPDTKEYGLIFEGFYFSYLEFYKNPYGPGYHWHRINSNGTVIEKGELRL